MVHFNLSLRKILYALGASVFIVILLLSGAVLYLQNYGLQNVATEKGSKVLGRSLAMKELRLIWNWTDPQIKIRGIKIANTEGFKDPDLFAADALDLRIKIWPLLIGQFQISDLRIDTPVLILEKKSEDAKNWDLPIFSNARAVTETVVPEDRHDFPLVGTSSIRNGKIIYRDLTKKIDLELILALAEGGSGKGNTDLKITGKGTLQDKVFSLDMTGGSIDELRDSSKTYPLTVNLQMGDTRVDIKGHFKEPIQMTGIDATLSVEGHNMADIFYLTALPLPPTPPYKLQGHLSKVRDVWAYEDFSGKVGDSDLAGSLSYNTAGERGFAKINLNSKLMDMDDLGGFIGLAPSLKKGETSAPEQKVMAAKQAASEKALPDVSLNLDRLRATDLEATLRVDKLHAPGWPINSLDTHIVLKEGVLTFDPVDLGIAGGQINGMLVVDASKDIPSLKSDLVMKKLSLGQFFMNSPEMKDVTSGKFGGRVQLTGQGKSLAKVLGSSDGRVTFVMAGGKISLLIMEAAGIDIAEAAPLLLDQDRSTHIRCAIGDFKVTNGLLRSETFVFDTNDTNVSGTALINLKNEELDIKVSAHPKDPSILSARTPITVKGTLKDPSVGLSPEGLAGRGATAVILGALLTPVAAMIPFIEVGLGEDSDCRGLIQRAKAKSGTVAPQNP